MISKWFSFILFFTSCALSADVICINSKEFKIPEIARRANISASYRITIDVVNYKPQIIKISPIDSISTSFTEMFNQVNKENIQAITYLKDTLKYELLIQYLIKPAKILNKDYAEVYNENVLRLNFTRPAISTSDMREWRFSPEADSLFFENYITYSGGNHFASNILVERVFKDKSDSTYIRFNNHPELNNVILEESAKYSKELFVNQIIGNKSHKAQKYFIRFYLRRFIQNCGYDVIF